MIQVVILIAEIILLILREGLTAEGATSKVSKDSGVDYQSLYRKVPNKYK